MRQRATSRPSEASDEGVGSREQLVRVPIQRGTMTSCSLRDHHVRLNGCDGTRARRARPVFAQRTADGPISCSGVLWPRMAAGVREDHGDD